jgi:hypothetical protein
MVDAGFDHPLVPPAARLRERKTALSPRGSGGRAGGAGMNEIAAGFAMGMRAAFRES